MLRQQSRQHGRSEAWLNRNIRGFLSTPALLQKFPLYAVFVQKKDWHILRNIVESHGTRFMIEHPRHQWKCSFRIRGIRVDVTIRIGTDWWSNLGGEFALIEVLTALIRSCVIPTPVIEMDYEYIIADLGEIVSTSIIPSEFNVSLLQRSQLEWLFFLSRHYCDTLTE